MKARARIRLIATADGGRVGPIASGYVTLVGIDEKLSSVSVHFAEVDRVDPGGEEVVELFFSDPEHLGGRIRPGARVTLNEGLRRIGDGVIIELLP